MSVALIVTNEGEAERLLLWAWRIAVAESMDLTVIRVSEKDEPSPLTAVSDSEEIEKLFPGAQQQWSALDDEWAKYHATLALDESQTGGTDEPSSRLRITFKKVSHPRPGIALSDVVPKEGVTHLILPLDERIREGQGSWKGKLYRTLSCQVMFFRVPQTDAADMRRILVPTAGSQNADAALRLATDLAKHHHADVTALFVERPIGNDSQELGERILDKIVKNAVGNQVEVRRKVVVAESLVNGIREEMADPYDLVLIGAFGNRAIRRVFFGSVSNELFSGKNAPAFTAVRAALPASTRLQQWLKRHVREVIPQLDREGRLKIVERVEASSKWDIDFIALTCLSTLIAALGLAGNQAPVIIGAMLVAPLMTPLVAAGLSLVQGNTSLIKDSMKSVLFGFLLAFLVGCAVGFVVPIEKVPTEVLNRTHPTILDLAVALVSGVAAAYAMSRPNLLSALPGVAIAAALVPPIATAGLSVALALSNPNDSYHHWVHAIGATILFATNIVAIVLGTAVSLWAVGIQSPTTGKAKSTWMRWPTIGLMVALVGLGFVVSHNRELKNVSQAMRGVADEFTRHHQSYALITDVRRGASKNELIVDLESDVTELQELPEDLLSTARRVMKNAQLDLKLLIRHVIRTDASESRPSS